MKIVGQMDFEEALNNSSTIKSLYEWTEKAADVVSHNAKIGRAVAGVTALGFIAAGIGLVSQMIRLGELEADLMITKRDLELVREQVKEQEQ